MRQKMTRSLIKIALVLIAYIVSACTQVPVKQGQPEWLLNPGNGVVASCGFHIKGHYAQQECAIQRARERLAARQGVEVSSVSQLTTRVHNDRESVTLNKETREKVNQVTVKARVRESWYDAQRDEYYVWVFAE
ncbi:LPP20 family lipoprotein [Bacterioplanoides sp. SCSIO 12839]|uniref:LPP20 family lipoprotein n=1 Tax=Bacterioplanoides sp. SCSIO 12839 TaxID=2829569 RepID=UPI0021061ADD|nr:LPP20 family lipoprotein [Bacterioplanoides sp. SCSIO 12839]UTW48654.1 LPP20 family lipoprotein [Bacterioplanoides sp. SCSIO 12839]